MKIEKAAGFLLVLAALLAGWSTTSIAGGDRASKASNIGSIANTRHNMTQSFLGAGAGLMESQRNNYGEVCVYCHTPHGANSRTFGPSQERLPLWNRTVRNTTYTVYTADPWWSLTQPVTQPGVNSLPCLSCHDGTTGTDSVINMPGSGGYNANQQITQDDAFLGTWDAAQKRSVPGFNNENTHAALAAPDQGCLVCHTPTGSGAAFPTATDFRAFAIGTNLTNDHPVGVRFPDAALGLDFNDPNVKVAGQVAFFDHNGNSRLDKNEVRLYDTGDGYEVECASCHDPHGVPQSGPGSKFIPTFLRVPNTPVGGNTQSGPSALCLTCHVK